jgi:hypothetical protein
MKMLKSRTLAALADLPLVIVAALPQNAATMPRGTESGTTLAIWGMVNNTPAKTEIPNPTDGDVFGPRDIP